MINFLHTNYSSLEEKLQTLGDELRLMDNQAKDIANFFADTKKVDDLCQEIGQEIIKNDEKIISLCQKPFKQNLNVYISFALYDHGGHTREIEDWINETYSDRENVILLSMPSQDSHKKQLQKFADSNVRIIHNSSKCSLVERVQWIQKQLAEIRPEAIFVSTALIDTFVLAAIQPQLVNKLYWNLSLDSGISPGLHIKSITKIIVKRPYLYFYLKEKLKLTNLAFIPFNRPDVVGDLSNYVSREVDKKTITASCTSAPHKISSSYEHKFIEVIPTILSITKGSHIHIGAILPEELEKLHLNMQKLGVDKDKFIRIEFVTSVAKALIENDVDILIQTFPIGGGLVTIEAMQSGKMIINNKNYRSHLLNVSDFCYEGAFAWSDPSELYKYLKNLTRDEIVRQSHLSRQHYQKNNHSKNLKTISDPRNMVGISIDEKKDYVDEQYNYALDYYQKFLEDLKSKIANPNKLPTLRKKTFTAKIKNSLIKRTTSLKKIFGAL